MAARGVHDLGCIAEAVFNAVMGRCHRAELFDAKAVIQ